jgi:hypothetical protein
MPGCSGYLARQIVICPELSPIRFPVNQAADFQPVYQASC